MKRAFSETNVRVFATTLSLMMMTSGATAQAIDLDALMQQMDSDEVSLATAKPLQKVPEDDEGTVLDDTVSPPASDAVLRQLPSSYAEVAAYAGRIADHDVDHTGQIIADVCTLVAKASADLAPQSARLCNFITEED